MGNNKHTKPASKKPTQQTHSFFTDIFSAKWMPWFLVLVIALLVAGYFLPVLQGKVLASHDTDQYTSMYKEINDYHQKGETIYWTTRIFSGMPAALISVPTYNVFTYAWIFVNKIIPSPMLEFLMMTLSAFFIFRLLGFGYLECFLAAIVFGFGSTNFISVAAGHMTKVRAIAVAPILIGGAWMALSGKWFRGGVLFAIILGLQISFNHIQITYYTFLILSIMYLFMLIQAVREKAFRKLSIGTGVLALGVVLAVALNSAMMVNTYDYSKESTRGERILPEQQQEGNTQTAQKAGESGVGIAYATNWSQGIGECMTFLIPNFYGGASTGALDETSNTYKLLTAKGVAPTAASGFVSQLPLYWGNQPFVAGPIYFGAVVILLFVIGLFLVNRKYKWWMLAAIIFSLMVAFGKNMMGFYEMLYNTLPMFNKFRSPTMFLALTQMLMSGMAILCISVILKGSIPKEKLQRALKIGGGIVFGICLLMALIGGSMFSFSNDHKEDVSSTTTDQQFVKQLKESVGDEAFATEIYNAVKNDRKALMTHDAYRSTIFVALALALLYLASLSKLNMQLAVFGVSIIALVDLWGVNKRYLNDGNFTEKEIHTENLVVSTPADDIIRQNGADARMLDFTVSMFNDASPGYFHYNVGGYHPAKLRRYQDLIERGISPDLQSLNVSGLSNIPVLNMLNTKFFKTGSDVKNVVLNEGAMGRCWLVDSLIIVDNDLQEIEGLHKYNLSRNAIVHKEFNSMIKDFKPSLPTSEDTIYLTSFEPDKVTYKYNVSKERVAVFSEVIYKPNVDWTSTIDDKVHPHFRANYILRAMVLPAGEHTITFKFLPVAYSRFKMVSAAASAIIILLIGLSIFRLYKRRSSVENK